MSLPRSLLLVALLVYGGAFTFGVLNPETRWTVDSHEYALAARNLADSGTLYAGELGSETDPALYTRRPPLYPLLVLLPLLMTPSGAAVALVQIALTFAGAWLVWRILSSLRIEGRLRRAALGIYLLYPAQIIYSQAVMAEILLQFLFLLALYVLLRFLDTERVHWLVLMNVALALAPLCKPIALYFWIPNLGFQIWLGFRYNRRSLILLGLIPLLSVSLWSYRNQLRTGHYHFSSIVTQYMRYTTPRELREETASGEIAREDNANWHGYWRSRLENWPRLLPSHIRGAALFLVDPGRFDFYLFFGLEHNVSGLRLLRADASDRWGRLREIPPAILVSLVALATLNIAMAAAFPGFLLLRRTSLEIRIFMGVTVGYHSLAVGTVGFSRYRLAVEPYLVIGAILTVSWLLRHYRSKRRLRACPSELSPRLED
jgi:hypothetical protein